MAPVMLAIPNGQQKQRERKVLIEVREIIYRENSTLSAVQRRVGCKLEGTAISTSEFINSRLTRQPALEMDLYPFKH